MSKREGAPKLAEALKEAERLGLRVERLNRTGEWKISTPWGGVIKANARKKDAPEILLKAIRQQRQRAKEDEP